MKLYHIIGLSTAGLLSLGGLGFIAQSEATEYNIDYRLETLNGDVTALNGVQFVNTAKTGSNSFSKVTLIGEKANTTPTTYDMLHGVGEDVLENRELYRNLPWPEKFEDDKYLITANFNYSYNYTGTEPVLRIRVKNKETGTINIQEPSLKEISYGDNMMREFLTEVDGTYYYLISLFNHQSGTSDTLLTYQFNPETLAFNFEHKQDIDWSSIIIKDGLIYTPNETNELIVTNIATGESKTYTLDGHPEYSYINDIIKKDDQLFLLFNDGLYEATLSEATNTATLTPTESPKFFESLLTDFEYYTPSSMTEHNDYIYTMYDAYKNHTGYQYISVTDTATDQIVYEGKIMLRSDQGLIGNYQLKTIKND